MVLMRKSSSRNCQPVAHNRTLRMTQALALAKSTSSSPPEEIVHLSSARLLKALAGEKFDIFGLTEKQTLDKLIQLAKKLQLPPHGGVDGSAAIQYKMGQLRQERRTSPRGSPRTSPRGSPRSSPRASPLR